MYRRKLNDNWKFWNDGDAFALVWNIPDYAVEVDLPHDAMMTQAAHEGSANKGNTGYRDGGNYVYVKTLYAPAEWENRTIQMHFEGIYMNAMVYVNEQPAARCPYGYTGFYVNLNDHLRYGQENEIRVLVRNGAMTSSRWYSGSGIYRDVYLLEADTVYIKPEEVRVKTETLDQDYAVLQITTALKNRRHTVASLKLVTRIVNENGIQAAQEVTYLALYEQEEREMVQRLTIEDPESWSEKTPRLYTCYSSLYQGDVLLDESETEFGIRTLQVDAKRGLQVNGKEVKLRGACIHHDSGLLGAATYEEAHYRQISRMKEAGFNAIRMSHHPAAPALLRACDHLGMYVMDETFDMWTRCKSDFDYGLYFDKWWREDTEAMVRKDYNHPSVILYSIGNEIPEVGTEKGAQIGYQINEVIKRLDDTRFTLSSINGVFAAGDQMGWIMGDLEKEMKADGNVNDFMSVMDSQMDRIVVHQAISERLEMACANTDIAGYNYMTARYELDKVNYPNRIIVGSETYPPDIARNWGIVRKNPHVIGDFTWTGWDYIGEAGVGIPAYRFGEGGFGAQYPCQLAYCGDFDLTGFRRPASYFREIVFGRRKEPYITVQNPDHYGEPVMKTPWIISDNRASWTYPGQEGQPAVVEIYAPGEEVELFVNGVSKGRKPSGEHVGYRILFDTVYEPGELRAVAYEKGEILGECYLCTASSDYSLMVKAEETYGSQDENPIRYVDISLKDKNGVVYDGEEHKLCGQITGGQILGFGSADPKTLYSYQTNETETFYGRAQLIVRKDAKDTQTVVVVRSETEEVSITL